MRRRGGGWGRHTFRGQLQGQRFKSVDVTSNDDPCTPDAVAVPASPDTNVETVIAAFDAVLSITLAVVGFFGDVHIYAGDN